MIPMIRLFYRATNGTGQLLMAAAFLIALPLITRSTGGVIGPLDGSFGVVAIIWLLQFTFQWLASAGPWPVLLPEKRGRVFDAMHTAVFTISLPYSLMVAIAMVLSPGGPSSPLCIVLLPSGIVMLVCAMLALLPGWWPWQLAGRVISVFYYIIV